MRNAPEPEQSFSAPVYIWVRFNFGAKARWLLYECLSLLRPVGAPEIFTPVLKRTRVEELLEQMESSDDGRKQGRDQRHHCNERVQGRTRGIFEGITHGITHDAGFVRL